MTKKKKRAKRDELAELQDEPMHKQYQSYALEQQQARHNLCSRCSCRFVVMHQGEYTKVSEWYCPFCGKEVKQK